MPDAGVKSGKSAIFGRRFAVTRFSTNFLWALFVLLLASSFDAFQVMDIPVSWLVHLGWLTLAGLLILDRQSVAIPGWKWLLGLGVWLLLITLLNNILLAPSRTMPTQATTDYGVFVGLRFLNLLSFAGVLYVISWLNSREGTRKILAVIVAAGVCAAAIALYVYLAQLYGWHDVPRNRTGTAGGLIAKVFTYAFHRAMGTFREPSMMAEWLFVPLFACFCLTDRIVNIYAVVIGTAVLLTGSMTGILGSLSGLVAALLMNLSLKKPVARLAISMFTSALIAYGICQLVVRDYSHKRVNYIAVVTNRSSVIIKETVTTGLLENRAYIYNYLRSQPFPLVGHGVGNATIELSNGLQSKSMCSYLSLYLNILYSGGIVALILLAGLLIFPLWVALKNRKSHDKALPSLPLLIAYFSWLAAFLVHAEALSTMFALIYALLYNVSLEPPRRKPAG